MNTSTIGKIVSFDPATQMATIETFDCAIVKTISSDFSKTAPVQLVEVVCYFPRVQGFQITMPPKVGDICMVIFTQSGMTHWIDEGREDYEMPNGRPEPSAMRKYSEQDAFALIGFSNIPNPIPDFNNEDLQIRNTATTQTITMKANGDIEIAT